MISNSKTEKTKNLLFFLAKAKKKVEEREISKKKLNILLKKLKTLDTKKIVSFSKELNESFRRLFFQK